MDPTAASADTASALQSALDAAYREREALAQRLDEVDQLIADLSQAADSSSDAAARTQRTRKAPTRKAGTKRAGTKRAGKKSTKKSTKKVAEKSSAGGARKRTGTRTRKRAAGGEGMGRTDRVVQIIARADRPLTTGEVRTQLSEHEPGVTSKLVSASLSYAQRKGHIQKNEDGRWLPAAQSSAAGQASSG